MRSTILGLLVAVTLSGCTSYQRLPSDPPPSMREEPTLTTSLFASDNSVLSDEAIDKILSSKLALPSSARIAIMKLPGRKESALRYYGSYYWRSEEFLKAQQKYIDTISRKLDDSPRISRVTLLPSLLTPEQVTLPLLREAAVRLQSDLVLVLRVDSDIYYQSKLFSKDKVKSYGTCEAVLLDVRTGIIPFTSIVTEESIAQKSAEDFDINETMRRAEIDAILKSLNTLGDQLVTFLKTP